jgi:GTP cyclohydrolase I
MIDKQKVAEGIKLIIEAIGEDPGREGLIETPERVARMFEEIFEGIGQNAEEHLSKVFTVKNDDIVIERDITFYSMCEHHLLPFYGKAHIAYIPNGKVAGLSKLARTVDTYAKRPQLQEQLTSQIGEALMTYLGAKGVMVILEAEHMCMSMRGIKKSGSKTVTMMSGGIVQEDRALRQELYAILAMSHKG